MGTADLGYYEGLIAKTSEIYAGPLAMEREDLEQILLTKVWWALEAYDPARSSLPRERYVFSCMRNQIKDLVKAKVRKDKHGRQVYIDDLTSNGDLDLRDRFEYEHLSEIPAEPAGVDLPESLSEVERQVVGLLYVGYRQMEIATILACPRREIERRVLAIKRKLAGWRPAANTEAEVVAIQAQVQRVLRRVA